jgi:hypothetical protein
MYVSALLRCVARFHRTLSSSIGLRHPLYVVSAGDLGVTVSSIDKELIRVFKITAIWNAVVVIDEADVFLEKRSLRDLERNAMVAVFLRHLEYVKSPLFI